MKAEGPGDGDVLPQIRIHLLRCGELKLESEETRSSILL